MASKAPRRSHTAFRKICVCEAYALKANGKNGLHRNNADKRHALEMAWNERDILFKGKEPTSRQLAALCGVSDRLAAYFIEEKGVRDLHNTSDATTCTEDHLEERNPNVLRNLKEGKDRFDAAAAPTTGSRPSRSTAVCPVSTGSRKVRSAKC